MYSLEETEKIIKLLNHTIEYKLKDNTTYCYIVLNDSIIIEGSMYGLEDLEERSRLAYLNAVGKVRYLLNKAKELRIQLNKTITVEDLQYDIDL